MTTDELKRKVREYFYAEDRLMGMLQSSFKDDEALMASFALEYTRRWDELARIVNYSYEGMMEERERMS